MFIMYRTTVGHIACMSAAQVLEVMTNWHTPVTMSVMRWQDVEEEDLSQQCPASHPFAFHNVGANTRTPQTSCLIVLVRVPGAARHFKSRTCRCLARVTG